MYFEKKTLEQFFQIKKSAKIFLQVTKRETTVPIEKTRTIVNKNCLGSFQVLWNKNCTTENEKNNDEKID
jgi:hypothetical protein